MNGFESGLDLCVKVEDHNAEVAIEWSFEEVGV